MEQIIEALKLMVIGLGTVFAVLLLVIWVGNMLATFVNKFIPEDEEPATKAVSQSEVNAQISQVIAAAVNTITAGKGYVEKIEKIK